MPTPSPSHNPSPNGLRVVERCVDARRQCVAGQVEVRRVEYMVTQLVDVLADLGRLPRQRAAQLVGRDGWRAAWLGLGCRAACLGLGSRFG